MPLKNIIIFCIFFSLFTTLLFPNSVLCVTGKNAYFAGESCYKKLRNNPSKQKYRDNWLRCIEKFQSVYRSDPNGPWAAAGLYMSGVLYRDLYKKSYKGSDRKEAVDIFKRVTKRYPKSKYRQKALSELRTLPNSTGKNIGKKTKKVTAPPSKSKKAQITPKKKTVQPYKTVQKKTNISNRKKFATISNLRFWSNPSYTRIVIDADKDTLYTHRLLKKDPSIDKPQRLYIDLSKSKLDKNLKKFIQINDNLLTDARAGQFSPETVRVVVDIKSFKNYKIFSLKNPFRIVIDVWGKQVKKKNVRKMPPLAQGNNSKSSPGDLAKQLALGVSRIVIDPGHGGRDYGAPGYLKGVHEKDITLKIGRKLAEKLKKELKCQVIMTRNSDKHLTLEERTAIANTKNADLFISIHTNSHKNRRAYGIETYFLNLATDEDAILVAARENATSTKNISDLHTILNDLMQHAKINESSRLASYVQNSIFKNLKRNYSGIKNKGVKQAPFYVLLGAQMPAILVETSFISNHRECKRLISSQYQDKLCQGIINGIQKYIKETAPGTLSRTNNKSLSKR